MVKQPTGVDRTSVAIWAAHMILTVTSQHTLRETWPPFARTRDAAPMLVLALMVWKATRSAIQASTCVTLVRRDVTTLWPSFAFVMAKAAKDSWASQMIGVSTRAVSGFTTFVHLAATIRLVVAAKRFSDSAPLYLAAASGGLHLLVKMQHSPALIGGQTLQFMVRSVTFAVVSLLAAVLVFPLAIIACYMVSKHMFAHVPHDADSYYTIIFPKDAPWDPDYTYFQYGSLICSWVWAYAWFGPIFVVCLAYSHDISQAGLGSVTRKEAQEIISRSHQSKDRLGRIPILLSSATLSTKDLSHVDFACYNAALRTLVACQVLGLAFDVSTGWCPRPTLPPDNTTPLSELKMVLFASIWPLVAFSVVCAAIVFTITRRPNRSFRSVWLYQEDWTMYAEPWSAAEVKGDEASCTSEAEVEAVQQTEGLI